MKKKFVQVFLIVLICTGPIQSSAQYTGAAAVGIYNLAHHKKNKHGEDVVYLKNGSVIHGTIVELEPDKNVRIVTSDNSILIFKMNEVEKITKDTPDYHKESKGGGGYVNNFDVGYLLGIGDGTLSYQSNITTQKNAYHGISVRDVNGFHASNSIDVGLGLGYEYFTGDTNYLPATEYIPIFFDMRGYFESNTNTSAGFIFDIGYDIGLTTKYMGVNLGYGTIADATLKFKGGAFFNPAFCIRFKSSSKLSYCLNLGYEYTVNSIDVKETLSSNLFGYYQTYTVEGSETLKSGFFTFRGGIEF